MLQALYDLGFPTFKYREPIRSSYSGNMRLSSNIKHTHTHTQKKDKRKINYEHCRKSENRGIFVSESVSQCSNPYLVLPHQIRSHRSLSKSRANVDGSFVHVRRFRCSSDGTCMHYTRDSKKPRVTFTRSSLAHLSLQSTFTKCI